MNERSLYFNEDDTIDISQQLILEASKNIETPQHKRSGIRQLSANQQNIRNGMQQCPPSSNKSKLVDDEDIVLLKNGHQDSDDEIQFEGFQQDDMPTLNIDQDLYTITHTKSAIHSPQPASGFQLSQPISFSPTRQSSIQSEEEMLLPEDDEDEEDQTLFVNPQEDDEDEFHFAFDSPSKEAAAKHTVSFLEHDTHSKLSPSSKKYVYSLSLNNVKDPRLIREIHSLHVSAKSNEKQARYFEAQANQYAQKHTAALKQLSHLQQQLKSMETAKRLSERPNDYELRDSIVRDAENRVTTANNQVLTVKQHADKQLMTLKSSQAKLESENESLRQQLADIQRELGSNIALLEVRQSTIEDLESKLQTQSQSGQANAKHIQESKKEKDSLQHALKQYKRSLNQAKHDLQALRQERSSWTKEKLSMDSTITKQEHELARLAGIIRELQSDGQISYEKHAKALKAQHAAEIASLSEEFESQIDKIHHRHQTDHARWSAQRERMNAALSVPRTSISTQTSGSHIHKQTATTSTMTQETAKSLHSQYQALTNKHLSAIKRFKSFEKDVHAYIAKLKAKLKSRSSAASHHKRINVTLEKRIASIKAQLAAYESRYADMADGYVQIAKQVATSN